MTEVRKFDRNTDYWIKKLKLQAEVSRGFRNQLYETVDLASRNRVLDVGCGTGTITKEISHISNGEITGIDIDKKKLRYAKEDLSECKKVKFIEMNVIEMPFEDEFFDIVLFNLVLLHIPDQVRAIREMARVTKVGGVILASIEVDYAGSFEYPDNPAHELFLKDKEERGIDLHTGRKLKSLFTNAKLETEVGPVNNCNPSSQNDKETQLERFQRNFPSQENILVKNGWDDERISKYKKERLKLINMGSTFYFEPAFYAIGRK